jgi:integrase
LPKEENRQTVLAPHAVAALRLLIFTGCRLGEILHLRWSDVDFERGMLHLADSKTGKKSVVLNAPALAVLDAIPRVGDFVIAGQSRSGKPERPRSDLKKPWSAIRRHAGLEGLRIHDLRHSFASVGAGAGLGLPIVGKLLGHTQASTTQKYAHLDNDPLRRASNAIGATIAAAMAGQSNDGPARVVQLGSKSTDKRSRG